MSGKSTTDNLVQGLSLGRLNSDPDIKGSSFAKRPDVYSIEISY